MRVFLTLLLGRINWWIIQEYYIFITDKFANRNCHENNSRYSNWICIIHFSRFPTFTKWHIFVYLLLCVSLNCAFFGHHLCNNQLKIYTIFALNELITYLKLFYFYYFNQKYIYLNMVPQYPSGQRRSQHKLRCSTMLVSRSWIFCFIF